MYKPLPPLFLPAAVPWQTPSPEAGLGTGSGTGSGTHRARRKRLATAPQLDNLAVKSWSALYTQHMVVIVIQMEGVMDDKVIGGRPVLRRWETGELLTVGREGSETHCLLLRVGRQTRSGMRMLRVLHDGRERRVMEWWDGGDWRLSLPVDG